MITILVTNNRLRIPDSDGAKTTEKQTPLSHIPGGVIFQSFGEECM